MSRTPALPAVRRLGVALDALARALASPDVVALVRAESELAVALTALGGATAMDAEDRAALLTEIRRARLLLLRCRSLGSALTGTVQSMLTAQGLDALYDRGGAALEHAGVRGAAVKARL